MSSGDINSKVPTVTLWLSGMTLVFLQGRLICIPSMTQILYLLLLKYPQIKKKKILIWVMNCAGKSQGAAPGGASEALA